MKNNVLKEFNIPFKRTLSGDNLTPKMGYLWVINFYVFKPLAHQTQYAASKTNQI
jgi:hypothetical protein